MSTKKEIEGLTHLKPGVAYVLPLLLILMMMMMMVVVVVMIKREAFLISLYFQWTYCLCNENLWKTTRTSVTLQYSGVIRQFQISKRFSLLGIADFDFSNPSHHPDASRRLSHPVIKLVKK
jgi:hypothetical protein